MRLTIKEHLGMYNLRNNNKMTMHDLAQVIYADRETTPASKYQRLMAINAGRTEAVVSELVKLINFFDIDCCEIIL